MEVPQEEDVSEVLFSCRKIPCRLLLVGRFAILDPVQSFGLFWLSAWCLKPESLTASKVVCLLSLYVDQ